MPEDLCTPTAPVHRIGIVGSGTMGAGIAELCARAGLDVTVAVSGPAAAGRGRDRLTALLDRHVAKARLTRAERDEALERTVFTAELGDLADRQFVIEAVPEREALKAEVFGTLDAVVTDPDAVLATNTSSLSIARLGAATRRPERVIGTHFFTPVAAMPLVELVGSLRTAPATRARAEHVVRDLLGKRVIAVPDRAGFLVNSLLVPYLLAAVRMVESRVATAEAIDQGMTGGCSHPMGPLRLVDLIGLDVVASTASAMYDEFKEALYAPPALLLRMVESGLLGKKTGRGFYTYG
ncbi:3-hydroxybutyryl-CoA dehydrogenase [Streptomyces sp. BBFR2]|uniref:3-hydroxybutyryl-CoA dehydrogenase n=1 Tax=Streptomyces sp. BBFR2 TaxID=3372854 RepID=UPI0037D9AC3D